jgi:hypothetical protein
MLKKATRYTINVNRASKNVTRIIIIARRL